MTKTILATEITEDTEKQKSKGGNYLLRVQNRTICGTICV